MAKSKQGFNTFDLISIAVWLVDVDLAVDIQYALAKFLGVRENEVDLVVLNDYERLPCSLIIDVLGRGRLIYCRDLNEYMSQSPFTALPQALEPNKTAKTTPYRSQGKSFKLPTMFLTQSHV